MSDEPKSDDVPVPAAPSVPASPSDAAAPSEIVTATEPSGDAIFEALWARVLEAWDDDKTHAALLEHAIRAERLPDAAGRYRALENDPEKTARAKKKLNGIVIAATQMLFAMKTPARKKAPLPLTLAAAVLCVATLVWLARQILAHR